LVAIVHDWEAAKRLERARRGRKAVAILLLLGRMSLVATMSVLIPPNTQVREDRDYHHTEQKGCGPLTADFTDPCNSALLAIMR
jgi:hypothetical protein